MKDEDATAIVSRLTEFRKQWLLEHLTVVVGDQIKLEEHFRSGNDPQAVPLMMIDAYQNLRDCLIACVPELDCTQAVDAAHKA